MKQAKKEQMRQRRIPESNCGEEFMSHVIFSTVSNLVTLLLQVCTYVAVSAVPFWTVAAFLLMSSPLQCICLSQNSDPLGEG